MLNSDYQGYSVESPVIEGEESGHSISAQVNRNGVSLESSESKIDLGVGEEGTLKLGNIPIPKFTFEEETVENTRSGGDASVKRKRSIQEGVVDVTFEARIIDRGEVPLLTTDHRGIFPRSMPGARAIIDDVSTQDALEAEQIGDVFVVKEVNN